MNTQKTMSPPNRIRVGRKLKSQLVSAGRMISWVIF